MDGDKDTVVIALGIERAFDRVWYDGPVANLWALGVK